MVVLLMRAGPLRERLAFQTKSQVSDGGGGYTDTWTTSFTVWGRAKPIKIDESIQQEQIKQNTKFEVTVRYRSTITPNMRILWKSANYRILSLINIDEKRKWLQLTISPE